METPWPGPTPRVEPDGLSSERDALEQWIEYHRATLLIKCQGLTAEQLATNAVEPSALSLLGIVRHMTEVERWWFRMHAGELELGWIYSSELEPNNDFLDLNIADASADLAAYVSECELSRIAVEGRSLEEVVPSRGDHPDRTRNLRWIFLHMIEEYARHNGHADLLRERIDGLTGE